MNPKISEIIEQISGLEPSATLVLASGFVREEWKSLCFSAGKGLIATAIQNPIQFAQTLVPESVNRTLGRVARVEMLRANFKQTALKEALPRLMEHRFRPNFYDSLDRALQRGRELFAHDEEAGVFRERLDEKNGADERRTEFFLLNRFWGHLLQARDLFDEARILEFATVRLAQEPMEFEGTKKIYWLHHFPMSPKLRLFVDELSRHMDLELIHSSAVFPTSGDPIALERMRAHSLEDAAHHLLDRILESDCPDLDAVVIEDRPAIRRTLERVASSRGYPLRDARDPTLLLLAEELKSALLPLELAAKNFPRDLVLAWINIRNPGRGELREKILERNPEGGLFSYRFDPGLHAELEEISARFPKKMTVLELGSALHESIRSLGLPGRVGEAVERALSDWSEGLGLLDSLERPKPLRFWWKELRDALKRASPPVPPLRHARGLGLYRVDQAVSFTFPVGVRVHFFGVGASFFEPREESTEWLSGRDLETLSREFALPGRSERRESARTSFHSWASRSSVPPVFWEHLYDEAGAEVESPELALGTQAGIELRTPTLLPVHPVVLPALSAQRTRRNPAIPPPPEAREFPVSFLDSLGNCPFTAYVRHLLGAQDERDSDFEIGNDIYGNLLHKAVEKLLGAQGSMSPSEAFDAAWSETRKPGWIRSERLGVAARKKAVRVLERLLESEEEYRAKSGASLRSQEEEISFERNGFVFRGRIDRTDQHADGLVVIDYKTSSRLTGGLASLETGKGLQLAAYALALREKTKEEIVSAQYVILSQDRINRNYGVLFKKWNKGKAADEIALPLSFVRAGHSSLFLDGPDETWAAFDRKLEALLRLAKTEGFPPRPADERDCDGCRFSTLCGRDRPVIA